MKISNQQMVIISQQLDMSKFYLVTKVLESFIVVLVNKTSNRLVIFLHFSGGASRDIAGLLERL